MPALCFLAADQASSDVFRWLKKNFCVARHQTPKARMDAPFNDRFVEDCTTEMGRE